MSQFVLSPKSLTRLEGVHPHLQKIVHEALKISDVDFAVLEGLRTVDKQRQLVAAGASQTMNSRHITGHAVDLGAIVGGQVRWDWPLYEKIAIAMKQAANHYNVTIEWGGDWRTLKDGPHFQLPFRDYPAT